MKKLDRDLKGFQEANPDFTFAIDLCSHTGKYIVQVEDETGWVCLHDYIEEHGNYILTDLYVPKDTTVNQ